MPPFFDHLIKAIVAANKFLFASFLTCGLIWWFGPGDKPGEIGLFTYMGWVSGFCGFALLWELGAALWSFVRPIIDNKLKSNQERAKERERSRKLEADAPRIVAEFAFLDWRSRFILRMMNLQNRKSFHGPRDDEFLYQLYNRGFVQHAPGSWPHYDTLFIIPDFVWSFLQQGREEFANRAPDSRTQQIDIFKPWRDKTNYY